MGDPILFTFTFTFNCHGIAISALHLGLNLGKTHISYCPGACQPKGGDTRLQVLGGRPCEQSRLGVRFDVARSGPGGCGVRILAAGGVFSVHQGPSDSTAAPAPVWTVVVQWLVGTLCVDSTDPAFARRTSQVRSRSKPLTGARRGRGAQHRNSQLTAEHKRSREHRQTQGGGGVPGAGKRS